MFHTPPNTIRASTPNEDVKDVAVKLSFQPSHQAGDQVATVQKHHRHPAAGDFDQTAKKADLPTAANDNNKRRLPRSHTVVLSCHLPSEMLLLLLLIALTGLVLYSDYQSKVGKVQADLVERKLRCQHNYTVNMCDDKSIRAQREFCLAQRFCMERNVTEELARSVRTSNIVGEVLKEFLDGLGSYALVLLGIFCLWLFRKRHETKPFTFYERKAYTEYCDC